MSLIPQNQVGSADLVAWYKAKKDLDAAKASEMLLRMKIFNGYFPVPTEGTNTVALDPVNGVPYALKAVYPINRKIDDALLLVATPGFREAKLPLDELVQRKPELVISKYRELTAEEQKLFDSVMEIKPGTPALSVVEVKKRS